MAGLTSEGMSWDWSVSGMFECLEVNMSVNKQSSLDILQ